MSLIAICPADLALLQHRGRSTSLQRGPSRLTSLPVHRVSTSPWLSVAIHHWSDQHDPIPSVDSGLAGWGASNDAYTLLRKPAGRSGRLAEFVTVSILLPSFIGMLGEPGYWENWISALVRVSAVTGRLQPTSRQFRRASTGGGQQRRSRGAKIRQWQRRRMVELKADERGRSVV